MSRLLFVVPPLSGHTRPTLAVGTELLARGHAVAWAGHPRMRPLVPPGGRLFAAGAVDLPDSQGLRGLEAFRFLWDEFLVPLAGSMRGELDAAIAAFEPELLVVDQHALAGAVAARAHGLPWVTSATTTVELVDPLAGLPKVEAWVRSRMDLLTDPSDDSADLRFSELLVLVYSTRRLIGGERDFPPHYAFVGPSLPGAPAAADENFPWEWFDDRHRHVFVSLGTVTREAGRDFLRRAVAAFPDDAGLRLVVVAPPGTFAEVPAHILVREQVPQVALLPFVDVVVSHAGHNTVCESLANGVPLVLAPIRDDQPTVAQQVVAAGAGIRVKYGRVRPEGLRAAVTTLLEDPAYRIAAEGLRESFQAAGGAGAAADRLEDVLGLRETARRRPAAASRSGRAPATTGADA